MNAREFTNQYMNAREFTNQLEELINHPAQKLVGNISSGYTNLTDDEVKKTLYYGKCYIFCTI